MNQSKPYAYLCGVPSEKCAGIRLTVNHGLGGGTRGHVSPEEAFKCHARHLLKEGWVQVGPRDFRPPDGGPILVLTKRTKFGGKLRSGKEGNRNMPMNQRGARTRAGVIFVV